MTNTDDFPVLYILMRTDMESMNAGKAMAQASHASNAFLHNVNSQTDLTPSKQSLVMEWQGSTKQGFGTVLVLAVNENEMWTAASVAKDCGFISGVVHDPTYPIRDGAVCHFLPIDTCAYVFGYKSDPTLSAILGNFGLHP